MHRKKYYLNFFRSVVVYFQTIIILYINVLNIKNIIYYDKLFLAKNFIISTEYLGFSMIKYF